MGKFKGCSTVGGSLKAVCPLVEVVWISFIIAIGKDLLWRSFNEEYPFILRRSFKKLTLNLRWFLLPIILNGKPIIILINKREHFELISYAPLTTDHVFFQFIILLNSNNNSKFLFPFLKINFLL